MANPLFAIAEICWHFVACMLFLFAFNRWAVPAIFHESANFLGVLLRIFWAWCICCMISPIPASITFLCLIALFVVFSPVIEIVLDEIHAFKHKFYRKPPNVELDHEFTWEIVARLKSSNKGYKSSQFYPVTLVDFNELDDPLWPHASIVYLVEIRRRCLLWKTIIIWQASVINGGRNKIHEFQMYSRWTDANLFGRKFEVSDDDVRCFQTNGVILVDIYDDHLEETKLCIYDIRHSLSGSCRTWFQRPVSICCLGRLVKEDKAIYGWRIRWSSAGLDFDDVSGRISAGIMHIVVDAGEIPAIRGEPDSFLFGNFVDGPVLRFLRSSQGYFGLAAKVNNEGFRVILFDPKSGQYVLNLTEEEMRHSDRQYNAHATLVPYERGVNRCPMVLSDRECIDCFNDGTVFRAQFKPLTLKYGTAKQLFRLSPGFRNRMNGGKFRGITGIDDMNGHFG